MEPRADDLWLPSRRELLSRCGWGLGALALAELLPRAVYADEAEPLAPKRPHFAPRAKRVVHLFMNGGPSQLDTFDPKPALARFAGKKLPVENLPTERPTGAAFPSPFAFRKRGQSGIEVSELFERVGEHADDLCVIRSMRGDTPNHEPSLLLMNTGESRLVRPSLGSWVVHGLGALNQNLPAYVALCPGGYPIQESQNWQAGFLPGVTQGTYIDPNRRTVEELVENVRNHATGPRAQREQG
jgi:hypothetical protein